MHEWAGNAIETESRNYTNACNVEFISTQDLPTFHRDNEPTFTPPVTGIAAISLNLKGNKTKRIENEGILNDVELRWVEVESKQLI